MFDDHSDSEVSQLLVDVKTRKKKLINKLALNKISATKFQEEEGNLDLAISQLNELLTERGIQPVSNNLASGEAAIGESLGAKLTKNLVGSGVSAMTGGIGGIAASAAGSAINNAVSEEDISADEAQIDEIKVEKRLDEVSIDEIGAQKKFDKESLKEVKLREQIDKAELKKVKDAQNSLGGSNAVGGTVSTGDPNYNNATAEDEAEKRRQELLELKEQNDQEVQSAIEDAKQEESEEIDKINSGAIPFPISFFASTGVFIFLGVVDSLVSSIPIVGDIIMAIILALVWFIPAMLLFDVFLYIRIVMFLIIDWAVGTFLGTIAGVIPVIGEAVVDFIPEAVVLMMGNSPAHMVKKTYEDKIPSMITRIKEKYNIKIEEIKAKGKDKFRFARKKLQGHFTGVAREGRKVIFILLVLAIAYLSQIQGLFGIITTQQITMTAAFGLILFICKSVGMIGSREFLGLLAFLGFNIVLDYILKADGFISQYIGSGNSLIVTILFIIFSLLLVVKVAKPESMSSQRMIGIAAFILLALSIPYMIGYVSSERFTTDLQQQSVERQAEFEEMNFMERLSRWYVEMQQKGSGTYIPVADKERVHEFIGVNLDGVEPARDEFLAGRPVQLNVFYSTGSLYKHHVGTTCNYLNSKGEIAAKGLVNPSERIPVSNLYAPAVKCVFEQGFPKGQQMVTVNSFYDFSSQIHIPLVFISEKKYYELLNNEKDVEMYTGPLLKPFTSSGPIDFGVSNTPENAAKTEEFKLPLVVDTDNFNDYPPVIKVRLDNPPGDARTQGELGTIKKVVFDLPEGLQLGNCNFQDTFDTVIPPTSKDGGRWKVDITDVFSTVNPYDKIICNLYIAEDYEDVIIPLTTDLSTPTMYYDIDYTYKLEKKIPVNIV